MDPNANWEELVRLANAMQNDERGIDEDDALRMAELVIALRDWLAKGGFPPKAFVAEMPNKTGAKLGVFSIRESKAGSIWVRAGSAFVNKDGSLNVLLDVLPLDGKLHVREVKPEPKPVAEE